MLTDLSCALALTLLAAGLVLVISDAAAMTPTAGAPLSSNTAQRARSQRGKPRRRRGLSDRCREGGGHGSASFF